MHKPTKNQTSVYKALSYANGPISAYALPGQLRGEGFRAHLQGYPALDKHLGIRAKASKFKISKTTLEMRGLCTNCLSA